MKQADDLDGLVARRIPLVVGEKVVGHLLPVCELHRHDAETIELMTTWRGLHESAFPTRFPVSVERTERWLAGQVLDREDRLLFMVSDVLGRPVGHLGLLLPADDDGTVELDNVVRGSDGVPGAMAAAVRSLEVWANEHLGIDAMTLRVLESNRHAREFYARLGYRDRSGQPLRVEHVGEEVHLVPTEVDDDVADQLMTMYFDITGERPASNSILTAGPSIGPHEAAYALDAVRNGWNSNHSDYLARFEREFAEYVGAEFAMATSSCTGALHLALLALGVGPGDEVIVPEITWVATASAVRYVGATPVFADIDPMSWTMSPESVETLISERTRVIMPVHLYGFAAEMEALHSIASRHGIPVVEDAAPAIGTLISGRAAGSWGDVGCYSFQGAKMLVTGEGGMLVTSDESLYARARKINDHGRKPGTFWIEELGHKYKMNNLTAALGVGQLASAERQIEQKRQINSWYQDGLEGIDGVRMQVELPNTRSICWMSSIWIDPAPGISADHVADALRAEGVDTRPVFPPISGYPIWDTAPDAKPNAALIGPHALNLPSGVRLSRSSVERVCNVIRTTLG